ncbi:MAG: hypothetical protein E7526_06815 [Ruminococcaceae bacterium]|nr:hypothetical protein [Oscillospiraceae bacterium]
MKKIKNASELLWVLGIVFVALGVTICSKTNLGVSMIAAPAFVVAEVATELNAFFNVGVTEYIIQGFVLIIMCIIVGRFNWRYLLAFAVAVLYGYTLNLFIWLFGSIEFNAVWLRYLMLIVGDVLVAFGVACFFRTYMPLQVYELFVAEIADRFKISITRVKSVFDITLLIISVLLAFTLSGDAAEFDWSTIWYSSFHSIGIGTLITTAINSPTIAFMGKMIDRFFEATPRFLKLEQILKRNQA